MLGVVRCRDDDAPMWGQFRGLDKSVSVESVECCELATRRNPLAAGDVEKRRNNSLVAAYILQNRQSAGLRNRM
jgi:hypothetical protein